MSDVSGLSVRNLTVAFPGGSQDDAKVVDDVSFDVAPGQCLVLVGESGSGKSMCCQAILGMVPAPGRIAGGSLLWGGRDLLGQSPAQWRATRGGEIAMVFQDPTASLNPLMRVGDQIIDVVRAHRRCSRRQAAERAVEVLRQVEFPDPAARMNSFPSELSGGLRQRVAIAMALACAPRLLIADEATTNLDVSIQAQIIALLRHLKESTGIAILFVTHDLGLAPEIGDDLMVLYAGHAVERGPVREVLDHPCHPYTLGLLASAPTLLSTRQNPLVPIPGTVPDPREIGAGAPFRSRCRVLVEGVCEHVKPAWTPCGPGHQVACHRYALEHAGHLP